MKHRFVSAIPDGTDSTLVRPQNNWNDTHIWGQASKSANYTLAQADDVIFVTAASTVTMPNPASYTGQSWRIINAITAGGTVTISPYASEVFYSLNNTSGFASLSLTSFAQFVDVMSDGTNWWVVGGNRTGCIWAGIGGGSYSTPQSSGTNITPNMPTIPANFLEPGDIVDFYWSGEVQIASGNAGPVWMAPTFIASGGGTTVTIINGPCQGNIQPVVTEGDSFYTARLIIGGNSIPPSGTVCGVKAEAWIPELNFQNAGASQGGHGYGDNNPTISYSTAYTPAMVLQANMPTSSTVFGTLSVTITR